MNTQTNSPEQKKSHKGLKIATVVIGLLVVLVVAVALLVPVYISSDGGTNMILGKINSTIDGKVEMQDLKVGWFSGVKLTDLKFADNAGTTSVNIKEISTKPKYVSLIKGQVALGKTVIDQPEVVITVPKLEAGEGESADSSKASEPAISSNGQMPPIALPDVELEVIKGNVTINLENAEATQSVEFRDIASKFDINPAGSKSTFDLALAVVGNGGESKISANGDVTPSKEWTLKGTSGDFNISIDDLELATLRPLMAFAGQDMDVSGKINAKVVAKVNDGDVETLKADAALTNFKSMTAGKEMVLDEPVTLKATASSSGETYKIEKMDITSSFCNVKCSGGMDAVDYSADVDIKELTTFAGQFADMGKFDVAGKLAAAGKVSPGDTTTASCDLNVAGFVLANKKTNKATAASNITLTGGVSYDKNTKAISFDSLKMNSVPVSMNLSGALGKAKGKSTFTAEGKADLAQIRPYLAVAEVMPETTLIAGTAQMVMNVEMEGDNVHIDTNNTQIANLQIKKDGQESAFKEELITLTADVAANMKDKSIAINKLNLDSTNIKITKGQLKQSASKGKTNIEGHIEAEYDLEQITNATSTLMLDNLTMAGKRSAILDFESSYPTEQKNGMLANMNAGLAFGFDSAEYLGLEIGKTDFDVKMTNGVLNIEPFSAPANNGKLNFAASVDFTQESPVLRMPGAMQVIENIQINDTLSNNFLVYVNPIFAGATSVSGIANLRCDELCIPMDAEKVSDIVVDGQIGISDLRMDVKKGNFLGKLLYTVLPMVGVSKSDMGADMALLPCDFTVKDSIVKYDEDMQLNIERYPLNFVGQIGIDTTHPERGNDRIAMDLYLPVTLEREVTVGHEDTPNRIVLSIKGKTNSPEVDLDALKKQLLNRVVEDQVGDLLDKALGGSKKSGDGGSTAEDKLKEAGKQMLKDLFK